MRGLTPPSFYLGYEKSNKMKMTLENNLEEEESETQHNSC